MTMCTFTWWSSKLSSHGLSLKFRDCTTSILYNSSSKHQINVHFFQVTVIAPNPLPTALVCRCFYSFSSLNWIQKFLIWLIISQLSGSNLALKHTFTIKVQKPRTSHLFWAFLYLKGVKTLKSIVRRCFSIQTKYSHFGQTFISRMPDFRNNCP